MPAPFRALFRSGDVAARLRGRASAQRDLRSALPNIDVALDALRDFTHARTQPGRQHRGTLHPAPEDVIVRGYDDAKFGRPSNEPVVERTIPLPVVATVAPPYKHPLSMLRQYAPHSLARRAWDATKDRFAGSCFEVFERYAPGFTGSVIGSAAHVGDGVMRAAA